MESRTSSPQPPTRETSSPKPNRSNRAASLIRFNKNRVLGYLIYYDDIRGYKGRLLAIIRASTVVPSPHLKVPPPPTLAAASPHRGGARKS